MRIRTFLVTALFVTLCVAPGLGSAWRLAVAAPGARSGGEARVVASVARAGGAGAATLMGLPLAAGQAPGWDLVPSPDWPGGESLHGVFAFAPGDVWAVGAVTPRPSVGNDVATLTEHWDGRVWATVPSPSVPASDNVLAAVAGSASDDVWAVGRSVGGSGAQTWGLIERWDGAQWTITPILALSTTVAMRFEGVTALARNDAWAVGAYTDAATPGTRSLIAHWDGTRWSLAPTPESSGGANELYGVAAVSPTDVWAVGGYLPASGPELPLVLHWDGSAWRAVPAPGRPGWHDVLYSVAVAAPGDLWAVGMESTASPGSNAGLLSRPAEPTAGAPAGLVLHWDGLSWQRVSDPSSPALTQAVAATGPGDVWVVGEGLVAGEWRPVAQHWDGGAWTSGAMPRGSGGRANAVQGVAAVAPADVWAVGFSTDGSTRGFIDHFAPRAPCAAAFDDVRADNPFFLPILTLACRGVIGGYSDGSFRPGAGVTRGQAARFAVNAAGMVDAVPAGRQSFADAPPGSPFWLPIERLAGRGVVSGYTCGGPGEPCDAQARPYFRPNTGVTRGQLAKILAGADGAAGESPGPVFADVAQDQPMYSVINMLGYFGVMSGYACGGAGEPCDSQNRPYFRPAADVTRGQTAKMTRNLFCPDCTPP